ncbi:hypothetical protein [Actinoplanes sp. CA-252034]|uniref:hypothetical protein n=1 Tax=Actinoplanes sp. CA-252034 TaxID=3239906 RepID=UPI003D99372B
MRGTLGLYGAAGLVVLSVLGGCAGRRTAGPVFSTPEPSATVSAPAKAPAPATAPASATVSAPASVDAGPPGDGPPNHADNNGWKQRHGLTAAEQKEGDRLAARVEEALARLRAAGDFAPESTRAALIGLRLDPERVGVTPMRQPSWMDHVPEGAVFEVRFGVGGCVVGDIRPERLLVEVRGANAEFGCLEPYTH